MLSNEHTEEQRPCSVPPKIVQIVDMYDEHETDAAPLATGHYGRRPKVLFQ
jgi:hypothetical protein